jgi:hypothetical protein
LAIESEILLCVFLGKTQMEFQSIIKRILRPKQNPELALGAPVPAPDSFWGAEFSRWKPFGRGQKPALESAAINYISAVCKTLDYIFFAV